MDTLAFSVANKRVDKMYKITRQNNLMESLLITFSDGSLEFVDSMESTFKPGCNFHFGSKRVSQVSSVLAPDRTVIFLTRQDSIEKMSFTEVDGEMKFEANSFMRFETDNYLPFVALKAKGLNRFVIFLIFLRGCQRSIKFPLFLHNQ